MQILWIHKFVLCLGKKPLFEGKDQYNRYTKIFSDVLKKNAVELRKLGLEVGDIGTHSARKGVATLVAAGCTVSPPITSICLRMGWAMGGVKDRYLKLADAGDQAVGRRANLSDPMKKEYAISPPYFDFSDIDDHLEKERKKEEIQNFISSRLSSGTTTHGKNLCLGLFASICFHKQFLEKNLHMNCPFQQSPFFNNLNADFVQLSRTAFPWSSTTDTPCFTGIPPHVSLLCSIESLQQELKDLKTTIASTISSEMDARGLGTTEFYTRKLEEMLQGIGDKIDKGFQNVAQEKRNNGSNEKESFEMFNFDDEEVEIEENIGASEVEIEGIDNANTKQIRNKRLNNQITNIVKRRKIKVGLVKGRLTVLPPKFEFPKMTCDHLLRNWFLGSPEAAIIPFSKLTPNHLHHVKNGLQKRQKMQRFMSVIERFGRLENCWYPPNEWDHLKVSNLWTKVGYKHIFRRYVKTKESRVESASWVTLYNKMMKNGAFKKKREDCSSDSEWSNSIYFKE